MTPHTPPPDDKGKLSKTDKQELNKLLDDASKVEQSIKISEEEIHQAFQTVATNTGIDATLSPARKRWHWVRYAAAAIFLCCAIGITYLFSPQTVTATNGETRTVQLSDLTSITLNSGSTITYPRWFGWWERTVTLQGEAFFEVTTTGEPFKVLTRNALVTVMGTRFNVRSPAKNTKARTTVFLEEGKVSFAPRHHQDQTIILQPGQRSWISAQQSKPAAPQQADAGKILAWMQQELTFENQSLATIFSELSHRFGINIQIKANQPFQKKLTIYLPDVDNVEQAMQDICKASGLNYKQKGDTFIILKPL